MRHGGDSPSSPRREHRLGGERAAAAVRPSLTPASEGAQSGASCAGRAGQRQRRRCDVGRRRGGRAGPRFAPGGGLSRPQWRPDSSARALREEQRLPGHPGRCAPPLVRSPRRVPPRACGAAGLTWLSNNPLNSESPSPRAAYPTPPGQLFYRRPSSAPSDVTVDGTGLTHTDRVLKSGWLLKAFGGVSLRTWKRRWVRRPQNTRSSLAPRGHAATYRAATLR